VGWKQEVAVEDDNNSQLISNPHNSLNSNAKRYKDTSYTRCAWAGGTYFIMRVSLIFAIIVSFMFEEYLIHD
jgi:hypothetical protein